MQISLLILNVWERGLAMLPNYLRNLRRTNVNFFLMHYAIILMCMLMLDSTISIICLL